MRQVLWVTALCVIGMGLMTACKSTAPAGDRAAGDRADSDLPDDGTGGNPADDGSGTPGDDTGDDTGGDGADPGDDGGDDDDSDPGDGQPGDDGDTDTGDTGDDPLPGGGGGDDDDEPAAAIVPGSGIAGITLGTTTRNDVESLYGEPESSVDDSVLYTSQGIIIWYDESNRVRRLLLQSPFEGETVGGNGIGSSVADFRSEFGSDDLPDASDNFRVWADDGIAVDFSADDMAERIEIVAVQ